jgi:pimeloyl-ACP methyl ester carboxylesterase
MSTFVLVHTAWNGTHCFRKVRPLLRAAGHDVVTPGLTGIGARIHLASPQVGLTTHIQDLVNEVLYEDLTDVVLLGYSYGGMVATGSLDYIADRVTHLVYLDAFVPADGESVGDVISRTGGPVLSGEAPPLVGPGSTWWLPPPPARAYDDADDAAWMAARLTTQPRRCFEEPVHLRQPLEQFPFTRTYIKAAQEPRPAGGGPFGVAGDHAKSSPAWRYHEIDTNHLIPLNRPEALATILLGLA